jgi:hypothetical protein
MGRYVLVLGIGEMLESAVGAEADDTIEIGRTLRELRWPGRFAWLGFPELRRGDADQGPVSAVG